MADPSDTKDGLEVSFDGRRVGTLREAPPSSIAFTYAPSWILAEEGFSISRSLPLAPGETVGGAAHAFFANLLPEGILDRVGAMLRRQCRRTLSLLRPRAPH